MWIIKTRSKKVVKFAENRGATVKKGKNNEFIIIPLSNAEAHRIYNKFSFECELVQDWELMEEG